MHLLSTLDPINKRGGAVMRRVNRELWPISGLTGNEGAAPAAFVASQEIKPCIER
jgi:hypothetical protein